VVDDDSLPYEDETNWLTNIERLFAQYLTPKRAVVIIAVCLAITAIALLLSSHPWHRTVRPSPYTFTVPGDSQQPTGATWTPGAQ